MSIGRKPWPPLTPEEHGQADAERELRDAQRRAAARVAELMAARECPADLEAWGRRHGIPEFARFTWQAGFLAGMRYRELLGEAPEE
jgi:hypothetical protein